MATMVRGTFPVMTTRAGLKKIYFQTYSQLKELYSMVLNTVDSQRGFEDFLRVSGLGRMSVINEGEPIPYDDAVEGTRRVVTPVLYGLGYQISRLLWDDEQFGVIKRMNEALARVVRFEQETQAFGLFNDADAGATYTGQDALPLIDAAHTLLKSTATFSNRLTADISASALRSAIDIFATMVDESNMNVAAEPKILVVPSQNRWNAAILTESPYEPETGNNAVNPLQDVGLSWFASPYITDTDSWFLLADKSNHDLNFMWRLRPEVDDTEDFDTKSLKFSAIQRFVPYFQDWHGVVGSMGT